MPHRIEYILLVIKQLEFISLNALSLGWILVDVTMDNVGGIPTWVSVLVGLSIVLFNVARAYKAYKEGKNTKEK